MKKSSLITKLVLLALAVFAVVTIVNLQPQIDREKLRGEELRRQIQQAEQKKAGLMQDIEALGTDEAVRKLARERLNLVGDGEIVFIDSGK